MSIVQVPAASGPLARSLAVRLYRNNEVEPRLPQLEAYVRKSNDVPLSQHPAWLKVLRQGFGHTAYCLEAVEGSTTRGFLPLAHVRTGCSATFW